jgi:hypothetical protein
MFLRVFIGWDSRFPEPARVLAYTLRRNSSVALDIRFLDYRHLRECYGFERVPDPTASTEFSFSRFLVPWLCGYQGLAVFIDNDVICLGDPKELLDEAIRLSLMDKTLAVVPHDYTPTTATKFGASGTPQAVYARKCWSSVMVMNCAKLHCWSKHVVETASGARLHRFQDIFDDQIVALPAGWNDLTHLTPATRLLHYTEGGPYLVGCEDCPHADLWLEARRDWLASEGKDRETPLIPVRL